MRHGVPGCPADTSARRTVEKLSTPSKVRERDRVWTPPRSTSRIICGRLAAGSGTRRRPAEGPTPPPGVFDEPIVDEQPGDGQFPSHRTPQAGGTCPGDRVSRGGDTRRRRGTSESRHSGRTIAGRRVVPSKRPPREPRHPIRGSPDATRFRLDRPDSGPLVPEPVGSTSRRQSRPPRPGRGSRRARISAGDGREHAAPNPERDGAHVAGEEKELVM